MKNREYFKSVVIGNGKKSVVTTTSKGICVQFEDVKNKNLSVAYCF